MTRVAVEHEHGNQRISFSETDLTYKLSGSDTISSSFCLPFLSTSFSANCTEVRIAKPAGFIYLATGHVEKILWAEWMGVRHQFDDRSMSRYYPSFDRDKIINAVFMQTSVAPPRDATKQ